jgi:hypothetical protein
LKATHRAFAPGREELKNRLWPGELEAEIRMSRGVAMRGQVVDTAGKPVHGVAVRNYPAEKEVFTDAEGRFEFAGSPAEDLRLDLWRVGYELKSTGPMTVAQAKEVRVILERAGEGKAGEKGAGRGGRAKGGG